MAVQFQVCHLLLSAMQGSQTHSIYTHTCSSLNPNTLSNTSAWEPQPSSLFSLFDYFFSLSLLSFVQSAPEPALCFTQEQRTPASLLTQTHTQMHMTGRLGYTHQKCFALPLAVALTSASSSAAFLDASTHFYFSLCFTHARLNTHTLSHAGQCDCLDSLEVPGVAAVFILLSRKSRGLLRNQINGCNAARWWLGTVFRQDICLCMCVLERERAGNHAGGYGAEGLKVSDRAEHQLLYLSLCVPLPNLFLGPHCY